MLEFSFNPFPKLESERLILRELTLIEAADYFAIRSNPKVMKYQGRAAGETLEDAKRIIKKTSEALSQNKAICWSIFEKENNQKLIGTIGFYRTEFEHFRTEIGYELHPDFWKKGIASEAMQTVLNYIFSKTKVHSVEANIDPVNLPSARILERNHFIKEAHFRENYFTQGRFTDSAIYSLLRSRHLALRSKIIELV